MKLVSFFIYFIINMVDYENMIKYMENDDNEADEYHKTTVLFH